MHNRPHCFEHPDLPRDVDMQLHGELFRLGQMDEETRREIAGKYGSDAPVTPEADAQISLPIESGQSDSNKNDGIWAGVVLSALLIIGMLLFAWLLDEKRDRVLEKLTWPTITAFESSAKVKKESDDEGSRYIARAKYHYDVQATRYETDWKVLVSHRTRSKSEVVVDAVNLRVRQGRPLERVVRYDPEDPSKSSFRNGTASRIAWIFFPLIVASGALIWLVVSLIVLAVRKFRSMNP